MHRLENSDEVSAETCNLRAMCIASLFEQSVSGSASSLRDALGDASTDNFGVHDPHGNVPKLGSSLLAMLEASTDGFGVCSLRDSSGWNEDEMRRHLLGDSKSGQVVAQLGAGASSVAVSTCLSPLRVTATAQNDAPSSAESAPGHGARLLLAR